eukprot:TRINITY_DN2924_c0_g2_i3.p1 TRINITY_DN2924_c0_g2~~TRINITY_DN2924_c0_g2_i3.p1  ORF type:complete len:159 (-),score=34.87 TRINITY_DN2924_c0_g2_i3:98-574(-)
MGDIPFNTNLNKQLPKYPETKLHRVESPQVVASSIDDPNRPTTDNDWNREVPSSPPPSPTCLGKRERDDEPSPHEPFDDPYIDLDFSDETLASSDTDVLPPFSPTLNLPIDGKRRRCSGTLPFDLDLLPLDASVEPAPSPVTEFNTSFQTLEEILQDL